MIEVQRRLGREDLFFLLWGILKRLDIDRDWLFDRCREVQANPNGYLDIWFRESYKSTILTYALTIQDILNDPDITIGIFSLTRPIAKAFLRQIKLEFEGNKLLKQLYPEILWDKPDYQAPKWSEDDGLVVKRKSNPKEATLEAWGLVDAMPTGRHFKIRMYDDIIDERNVGSPDMISKAIKAWELSLNLGSAATMVRYKECNIQRYAGTRYHFNDPYREIMRRGTAKPRIYPATVDGTPAGAPVLWDPEFLAQKRRDMGSYVFSSQLLCNPVADEAQGFRRDWIKYYSKIDWSQMNLYLLCDPAGEKKKTNDYTVMLVIGLGVDRNYYLIDGIRDRLNLTERTRALFALHRKYLPLKTAYEKYGKDSDIEHINEKMDSENYRFNITPVGGGQGKNDRIRKLIPLFEEGRFWIPGRVLFRTYDGKQGDLVSQFLEDEYDSFPVSVHDDILDCMARIKDEDLSVDFPLSARDEYRSLKVRSVVEQEYDPFARLNEAWG
jgi:predicted phage terminase large subunit-like protein